MSREAQASLAHGVAFEMLAAAVAYSVCVLGDTSHMGIDRDRLLRDIGMSEDLILRLHSVAVEITEAKLTSARQSGVSLAAGWVAELERIGLTLETVEEMLP
jgi:hypothetical protein